MALAIAEDYYLLMAEYSDIQTKSRVIADFWWN